MAAILSPTKASRDTRNNPAAVDALNPPPPLPGQMITRDVGRHWSDSRLRPPAVSGLHGLASTLDAVSNAREVVGDQMLVFPDYGLMNNEGMSLSRSPYRTSWSASLFGAQSAFSSQHSISALNSHEFTPVPLDSGRGDIITKPLDGRSTKSSFRASPCWAMSLDGSDSDLSLASDEEQEKSSAGIDERSLSVVNAPPRGPCSKDWSLPPKTRRKRKPIDEESTKKKQRKPGSIRRRGPFKDDRKRKDTALTRTLKGCIRCRMMRIRCEPNQEDPHGNCLTCERAYQTKAPSMRQILCLRYIFTDVSLYREQDMPCQLFSKRWQSMDLIDITDWASSEIKTITLCQNNAEAPYTVQVREFVPLEGDMLELTWVSGHYVKRHKMPQYALADMESAARALNWLTSVYVGQYIVGTVGNLDDLIWQTYRFAFRYQAKGKPPREKALIADCLKFWVACRKISNPEHIRNPEILGSAPVDDPDSPFHAMVPMPVIMIAQMECIMYSRILRPLSSRVLSALKDLVTENKREHWLTIYLTLFILLHSCAMLTRRDWETAREFNLQDVYANLTGIQGMQAGMQNMLAHFHYLNKGVLPFHLTYDEKSLRYLAAAADLDSEELEFVKQTSEFVNSTSRVVRMAEVRANKEYGDDMYWISQLYDQEWKPGPTA
ncbi:uncharacterized protein BDV17DRAFT_65363 [Aspergillus undulatus]|uniref:uncharacterized protein n=1 Tax=Aspergillus undulatus TaxID=1810928 RepID=UPI003CCE3DCE